MEDMKEREMTLALVSRIRYSARLRAGTTTLIKYLEAHVFDAVMTHLPYHFALYANIVFLFCEVWRLTFMGAPKSSQTNYQNANLFLRLIQ
jgi:hypothetical protein